MRAGSADSEVLYFAYGANMAAAVLSRRSVWPTAAWSGVLRDYQLVFDAPGIPWLEPAFANIVATPGAQVEGVLYAMSRRSFRRLVQAEGRGAYYHPVDVTVEITDSELAQKRPGVAFQAGRRIQRLLPSRRYMTLLLEGARARGLSGEYVRFLENHRRANTPLPGAVMRNVIVVLEALFVRGIVPDRTIALMWDLTERLRAWRG